MERWWFIQIKVSTLTPSRTQYTHPVQPIKATIGSFIAFVCCRLSLWLSVAVCSGKMAANVVVGAAPLPPLPITNAFIHRSQRQRLYLGFSETNERTRSFPSSLSSSLRKKGSCFVLACLPPPPPPASESSSSSSNSRPSSAAPSTKLYVSGLSFRTTEESLRNAFKNFGQLVEVNLVMDKIANRPRGFAFLRYATEEESQKAIEGMHGKFLDGRVIFVEVAKPRSELRQRLKQNTR